MNTVLPPVLNELTGARQLLSHSVTARKPAYQFAITVLQPPAFVHK